MVLNFVIAESLWYSLPEKKTPWYHAEYDFNCCSGLVDVPLPFAQLEEYLDLDNGLGPHFSAFEIVPNFG